MPDADSKDTDNSRLEAIAAEVNGLRFQISTASQKESSLVIAMGIFAAVISAIFVGLQIYQASTLASSVERLESRADRLIDQTESEIQNLLNSLVPDESFVTSYNSGPDGMSEATMSISKGENSENDVYQLNIVIPFGIGVTGASLGKLIGYEYSYSNEFANALWEGEQNDSVGGYFARSMTNRKYATLSSQEVLVSETAAVSFQASTQRNSRTCNELSEAIVRLSDKEFQGGLFIRPIFEAISKKPLEMGKVGFVVRNASIFDCTQL